MLTKANVHSRKELVEGFLLSKFSEKGYFVKENVPVYLTSDMERSLCRSYISDSKGKTTLLVP